MPNFSFEAIGTRWQIDTTEPLTDSQVAAVKVLIDDYDRAFSRFRPDSVVTQMTHQAGSYGLPHAASALFGLYEELFALTDGAISPLVGSALVHLGYDAEYSLQPHGGPHPIASWHDVCVWDGERLVTTEPIVLDVGAIGKGQLVDLVLTLLLESGVHEATVDAGGDIAHRGAPLRVGLENPFDPSEVVGVVTLNAGAICGSATNRRRWGPELHHVLDARTAAPVSGTTATWATADSAMLADGAATALFFCDVDRVATMLDVAAVAVRDDRQVTWSSNLSGEIFA